ncbi:Endoplasmic reticulum mannosyl-oligosaccharide 1,2-alpha-mannosidase [Phytophthora pseudosyringae]|uniref:mannosyl-oligosaccharide 1,2-alpha-mannosidase n=1 Tax=Phytophthora pseudosyringae TaxID=221518 RepID=A0A8T1WA06_9STRA|nr:Endoplasmic reticulum mannosyl-oligosaccharide 1,2-alpha-mannosidase [Phytophthora pseudosyringae]
MEPRARRLSNAREPPLAPMVPPQFPTKSFTRGGSNRSGVSAPRSMSTAVVLRLLLGLLCVGIVAQWVLWSSSVVETQRSSADNQPNNGWMNHLRRIEHAAETPEPAPAVDAFEFEPPASDPTHEEEQRRRASYDPAMHNEDQKQVTDMVQWAWKGYSEYAYGHDSLNVKTYKGTGLPDHDMALTLVDALDTLYLVGMFDEFDRASEWVANNMEQRIFLSGFVSFFETTIRLMGGLLSSYYMSGHVHLLTIANKLGMALSPAFDVYDHGMPAKDFDVVSKLTRAAPSLAEVGTLQMEFKYLARLTGYPKYQEQVERISDSLAQQVKEKYTNGLLPVQINQQSGKIGTSKITMGANGDSYYEYLLKQWLLSGKKDEKFKTQYMTAVDGIMDKLLGKSKPNGFVFIGELVYGKFEPKMDHLVCFVPGMLALGYQNGMPEEHLTLAKQLMETCYQMYAQMEAKLAPEIMYFNMKENVEEDLLVSATDAFNLLRPETVESLMVLYRVTKDEKYREYGREIMKAFEKNCRLERGGYASIGNVAKGPIHIGFRNEMESFFIAETLKYLFLLFSDDSMLALDEISAFGETIPASRSRQRFQSVTLLDEHGFTPKRTLQMGGAASVDSASNSQYRYGEATELQGDKASDDASWIGTKLDMPPKPFSVENYFELLDIVGTGMLGKVRLVRHKRSSLYYILKSIKKKDVIVQKMIPQLEAERDAMAQMTAIRHPFTARHYSCIVDWWAFACVVYEMVSGSPPFTSRKNESHFELYNRILSGKIYWPRYLQSTLKDLLRGMLQCDPGKRLSEASTIKQHAWFENVDWDAVPLRQVAAPYVPTLACAGDTTNFDDYPSSSEETPPLDNDAPKHEFRNF